MSESDQRRRLGAVVALYHIIQQRRSWPFLRRSFSQQWNEPQDLRRHWEFPPEDSLWNLYNEPHFLGFQKVKKGKLKQFSPDDSILSKLSGCVKRVKLQNTDKTDADILFVCPPDCEPKWSTPDSQLLWSYNNKSQRISEQIDRRPTAADNVAVEYLFDLDGQQHIVKCINDYDLSNFQCLICGQVGIRHWEILLFHLQNHHPLISYEVRPSVQRSDGVCASISVSGVKNSPSDADSKNFTFVLPCYPNRLKQWIENLLSGHNSKSPYSWNIPQANENHTTSVKDAGLFDNLGASDNRPVDKSSDRCMSTNDQTLALKAYNDRSPKILKPTSGENLRNYNSQQARQAPGAKSSLNLVNMSSTKSFERDQTLKVQRVRGRDDLLVSSNLMPTRERRLTPSNKLLNGTGHLLGSLSGSHVNHKSESLLMPALHPPPPKRLKISSSEYSNRKQWPSSQTHLVTPASDSHSSVRSNQRDRMKAGATRSTKSPKEWPASSQRTEGESNNIVNSDRTTSSFAIVSSLEDEHNASSINPLVKGFAHSSGSARHRMKYPVPPAPGPGRHFFRNVSKRVLEEGEFLSESDDDVDQEWLEQRHIDRIKSSRRWTPAQKNFLIRWDIHFLRENLQGRRYVTDATKRFINANLKWLQESEARREFIAKLASLRENGTISSEGISQCMQLVEGSITSTTASSLEVERQPANSSPNGDFSVPNSVRTPLVLYSGPLRSPENSNESSTLRRYFKTGPDSLTNGLNSYTTPKVAQINQTTTNLLSGGSSNSPTPIRRKKVAHTIGTTTKEERNREARGFSGRPSLISEVAT